MCFAPGARWRPQGPPSHGCLSTVLLADFAAKGEDPLFHKQPDWLKPLDEPPFAALAMHVGEAFYPYFTLGGLHVTVDGEVLDGEGSAIPGLYAAGRTACGLPRSALDYSSGMSLGDCTFFGRKAGLHAAERAAKRPSA